MFQNVGMLRTMVQKYVCYKSTCFKYNFGNKSSLSKGTPLAEEENEERAYFKVQNDDVIQAKVINTTEKKNFGISISELSFTVSD